MTTSNTSPIWTLRSDFGKLHKTSEGASFRELETSWGRQCFAMQNIWRLIGVFHWKGLRFWDLFWACRLDCRCKHRTWRAPSDISTISCSPSKRLSWKCERAYNGMRHTCIFDFDVIWIYLIYIYIYIYICANMCKLYLHELTFAIRWLAQRFSPRPRSCKLHWFCCCELLGRLGSRRINQD